MMKNQITKSIIVNGDVPFLFETWKNFQNHSQFMEYVTAVTPDESGTYHWTMEGPLDTKLMWTTKTTRVEPNKRVAWKTIDGDLKVSGQATFTALSRGQVEMTVTTQTVPPDNLIEKVAIVLFENEDARLEKDLRNFKALIENRSS